MHQSESFAPGVAPSHSDELYYTTEDRGALKHGRSDNKEGSRAIEIDPDYVNDISDKGVNHVYEGLANELTQHTYEDLSK